MDRGIFTGGLHVPSGIQWWGCKKVHMPWSPSSPHPQACPPLEGAKIASLCNKENNQRLPSQQVPP